MIKVENLIVTVNGLSIEFDSRSSLNNFLYHMVRYNEIGKIEEVKVEKKTTNDVLNSLILEYGLIEIENLDLSVRSYNCLKRGGINYIEDILKLDFNTVSRIRNLGRRSVIEIEEVVNSFVRHNYIKWTESLETIEN